MLVQDSPWAPGFLKLYGRTCMQNQKWKTITLMQNDTLKCRMAFQRPWEQAVMHAEGRTHEIGDTVGRHEALK